MNFDAPGEIPVGINNLFRLTGNLLALMLVERNAATIGVPIAQLATLGARVALTGPCSLNAR